MSSQSPSQLEASTSFEWTFIKIVWAIVIFCAAGVAEIVGGWMVWSVVRGNVNNNSNDNSNSSNNSNTNKIMKKPFWYAIIGSFILIVYGFIPCLQPTNSFGRIYAVYGGFFIVLSFLFGWYLDGDRPDMGDIIGSSVSLLGVLLIMLWPRT